MLEFSQTAIQAASRFRLPSSSGLAEGADAVLVRAGWVAAEYISILVLYASMAAAAKAAAWVGAADVAITACADARPGSFGALMDVACSNVRSVLVCLSCWRTTSSISMLRRLRISAASLALPWAQCAMA